MDDDATRDATGATADDAAPRVRPVDLRDYADFRRGPATRVRVFTSGQLALDLLCLEPGASSGVLHHPDQDVAYTVIGGRSWFVTDDGEVGLDPLGAMLVPADTVHGIDNRVADPLIVLAVMAPPGATPEDPTSADADAVAAAVHLGGQEPGAIRRVVETLLGARRPG
jgi:quercetin dioxygenase-like cupin family protein